MDGRESAQGSMTPGLIQNSVLPQAVMQMQPVQPPPPPFTTMQGVQAAPQQNPCAPYQYQMSSCEAALRAAALPPSTPQQCSCTCNPLPQGGPQGTLVIQGTGQPGVPSSGVPQAAVTAAQQYQVPPGNLPYIETQIQLGMCDPSRKGCERWNVPGDRPSSPASLAVPAISLGPPKASTVDTLPECPGEEAYVADICGIVPFFCYAAKNKMCCFQPDAFDFKPSYPTANCAGCYQEVVENPVMEALKRTMGKKKFVWRRKTWHVECFTCCWCDKQIGLSTFIPIGMRGVHQKCFEARAQIIPDPCCQYIAPPPKTFMSCFKRLPDPPPKPPPPPPVCEPKPNTGIRITRRCCAIAPPPPPPDVCTAKPEQGGQEEKKKKEEDEPPTPFTPQSQSEDEPIRMLTWYSKPGGLP